MVIEILNLKLRKILTFLIKHDFLLIAQHEELYHIHMVTSRYLCKHEVFLLKFFPHIFFLHAFVRQEDFRRTFAHWSLSIPLIDPFTAPCFLYLRTSSCYIFYQSRVSLIVRLVSGSVMCCVLVTQYFPSICLCFLDNYVLNPFLYFYIHCSLGYPQTDEENNE